MTASARPTTRTSTPAATPSASDTAPAGVPDAPTPTVFRDEFSRPFWEALEEGGLRLPWCPRCQAAVYYPRALCPRCHATDLDWIEASGRGRVYSHTTVRRPTRPFGTDAPFVVALVDLAEGARMLARITGVAPEEVRIGMAVTVGVTRVGELAVPVFRPADEEAADGTGTKAAGAPGDAAGDTGDGR